MTERMQDLSKILMEQLNGTSVYLIGLMGTGKSTAGRILAKALGYYFFDTDELIEKLTNRTVSQIFADEGEDEFRSMETEVLRELMQYKNCIVATGGGVPTKSENWGYMQQGIVVWLDGEPSLLARRVVKDGSDKRPLVASTSGSGSGGSEYDEVLKKLENLLEKRREVYSMSDIRVTLQGDDELDAEKGAPAGVVAYRTLEGLESKIRLDAEEREARKNFTIVDNSSLPSMRVMDSPVATASSSSSTPAKEPTKKKGFGK